MTNLLFVKYSVAFIAKEKGFKDRCLAFWNNGQLIISDNLPDDFQSNWKTCFAAPIYQQIIDWFREEHGISIYSNPVRMQESWKFTVEKNTSLVFFKGTYYEALDKAIQEAFNFIS